MTLKSITLHRPALDNLGGFHDSGTDMVVGVDRKAGVIDTDRALALVTGHGAAGHHAPAAKKQTAKPKAPAKAKQSAAPPAQQAPTPTPPTEG